MPQRLHHSRSWLPLLLLFACQSSGNPASDGELEADDAADGGVKPRSGTKRDAGAAESEVPEATTMAIGAGGGTLLGPNGAQVVIPPGALASNTMIGIEQTAAGAPALPSGVTPFGAMFAFTPHGTRFAVPVTVTIPFDRGSVPPGTAPALYKTDDDAQWAQLADASVEADVVSAEVSSFSWFIDAGDPGVLRSVPFRDWQFTLTNLAGVDMSAAPPATQIGGELREEFTFGTDPVFDIDQDGVTSLEVFSTADGVDFWASADAPQGSPHILGSFVAGRTTLHQAQSFIKKTASATLQFVITEALLEGVDFNGDQALRIECPTGFDSLTAVLTGECDLLQADVMFTGVVYDEDGLLFKPGGSPVLHVNSFVRMTGHSGRWRRWIGAKGSSTYPGYLMFWEPRDFEFVQDVEGSSGGQHPRVRLVRPKAIDVDLSSIAVGKEFWVDITLDAFAYNRRGRESAIGAYLRDPSKTAGAVMNSTGLEPTRRSLPPPAADSEPAPCETGPSPDAGVLQLSAATYLIAEQPFAGVSGIEITRSEGSSGVVSATLTTSGGSATPAVHYTPLETTVYFPDGDSSSRFVPLDIRLNDDSEPDRTVNLTLSRPGGCASLGPLSSAVLTILDDDRVPEPLPSGLDLRFGDAGKLATSMFGGDGSAMALAPDGKIVMVGGSLSDFILARYDDVGRLDQDFGMDGGTITIDVVPGKQEAAQGVAVQPDGRIVVVGYSGSNFALVRYDQDGSLDASFGVEGKVTSGVIGRAFAVAIAPDGKIVVAGDLPASEDYVLARFNPDGSLDPSFHVSGQLTTDIATGADLASNLVLQPDGAILVSGPHTNAGDITREQHTGLARFLPDGSLDPSFGDGGKLVLSDARVSDGLALQSDGKIVLAGDFGPFATTELAVMRIHADGSTDTGFGDGGRATVAVSTLGDQALAVAVQSDGKILAAGTSNRVNPNFAVARFNPDGTLDPSFAHGGSLELDFFGFSDAAESVAIQADGRIVLGGLARNSVDGYGLARVLP
jgi:uncharacterized delta-60 repeat protein